MPDFSKVAVIGGGSWATALVKILCENNTTVGWYVRNEVIYDHLLQEGHNPNYLSSVAFDMSTLDLHTDINKITQQYDVLIIACLLYTSPSPRDRTRSRMPSSA